MRRLTPNKPMRLAVAFGTRKLSAGRWAERKTFKSEFVEGEMARFDLRDASRRHLPPPPDDLNELFRRTLDEVWAGRRPT
jgi:hypothetical protein